ncbi:MAG TPA: energy transducer TonB [Candidatus Sulfotelmatobacter sp.]
MVDNRMVNNGMSGEPALGHATFGRETPGENMFTDTLLRASSDQRFRRSWTTLSSFGLQALAMGLLLMLPLVRPGRIELLRRLATPVSLGQPLPAAPPMHAQTASSAQAPSNLLNNRVIEPGRIPRLVAQVVDNVAPQSFAIGGTSNLTIGVTGLPTGIANGGGEVRPVLPTPPPPTPHTVRVSHMSPGSLIYQTQPVYPPIAKSARIEGQVVLAALISRDGTIENLRVVTGHPLLARSAVEAVSQWRYRPYILNNEPVEVETQITVNFYLAH